jgi:hypothetical protein
MERHTSVAHIHRPVCSLPSVEELPPIDPFVYIPSRQSYRATVDKIFDRMMLTFRAQWREALCSEPDGPAQYLRAYIRCVCAQIADQSGDAPTVIRILQKPEYRKIWTDFADEICSSDTYNATRSKSCRRAVERLWDCYALTLPAGHRFFDMRTLLSRPLIK